MDADRFDAFARLLSTPNSRRRTLATTLAGVVGTLAAARTEAKKKRKACPPCKKRKKGKCKGTLPDGSGCSGGTCQSGRCVAAGSPPPQRVCIPACAGKLCGDDGCGGSCGIACTGDTICQGGRCGCPSGRPPCAGRCCSPTQDCISDTCIKPQGTCPDGADFCVDSATRCGGGACLCVPSLGYPTRCGQSQLSDCNFCTTDAQCAGFYPNIPGVFCVLTTGDACGGCKNFCMAPCPESNV